MSQICIVEGNDGHVISNFLFKNNIGFPLGFTDDNIKDFYPVAGSVDKIPKLFRAALENSALNNIGVVLDANEVGVQSRYQSLIDRLKQMGQTNIPDNPVSDGFSILDSTGRKIGIWIMPDNINNGYIEHFLEKLISTEQREVFDQAKTAVDDYNKRNEHSIPQKAVQKGQAIKANYFDAKSEAGNEFLTWLTSVFEFPIAL